MTCKQAMEIMIKGILNTTSNERAGLLGHVLECQRCEELVVAGPKLSKEELDTVKELAQSDYENNPGFRKLLEGEP